MLTGDYLFYDQDWIRFFLRVTGLCPVVELAHSSITFRDCPAVSAIPRGLALVPEKRAMLGNCLPLIELLEF